MEKQNTEKSGTERVSAEFKEWVKKIQEEYLKKRGFKPSFSDITTDIKKQFTGQFIV